MEDTIIDKSVEFTGERWVFQEGGNDIIQREHMARYVFACKYVKDKKVLDIACGVGYGSYLLKTEGMAKQVVGADIDEDTVSYANDKYGRKGLTFQLGDAQDMPFADSSFDVVVSFETIEHLEDQQAYLLEVCRVLKPGGVFLVSTPDRDMYRIYNMGLVNHFHVHELSTSEFKQVLKTHFVQVRMYGQNQLDLAAWQRAVKIELIKRLVRRIDIVDLRKKLKKTTNSNQDTPTTSQGIYDTLDSTVRPLSNQPCVYLTAVCQKGPK